MLSGNVLITGATGLVGHAVTQRLSDLKSVEVTVLVRSYARTLADKVEQIQFEGLGVNLSYTNVFKGIDVVIHAAARVHVMSDAAGGPLVEFRKINVDGTLNLAKQAAQAGVKRFVFISSIKVNGESTSDKKPFSPDDDYIPDDPYGLSKYEAEQALLKLVKGTGMEVVIIRPPLIYGPGVKANFATMMRWVNKGVPLPLGAVHNKRSLLALDNLVDFILLCSTHPKAANEVFLISDGEDVSTTELLSKVAYALEKQPWLIPIPVGFMTFIARILGKKDVANRLFGSLQVDSSKARNLLGWKPVITMDEQLKKIVEAKQ